MPFDKNTPTRRALSMASMGADIAGSYIGYLLQRAFLGEARGKLKLKSTHSRAARMCVDFSLILLFASPRNTRCNRYPK